MARTRRLLALTLAATLLALIPAALLPSASWAGDAPKVIPMPAPPQGPPILRVTHDALRPVEPGARVEVRVSAGPGAAVSASLGRRGQPVPCPEQPGEKGAYACVLTVPPGSPGSHSVVATATGEDGRVSRLSSILPVVISSSDRWKALNTLNTRLAPILFAPGSSQLDDGALATLEASLDFLRSQPRLSLLVEGHCDPGEEGDQEALSLERARAVVDQLAQMGIPRERLSAAGLSSDEPLVGDGDEQARALNRRAMILFRPPSAPPGS